jgi:hypothetical protein
MKDKRNERCSRMMTPGGMVFKSLSIDRDVARTGLKLVCVFETKCLTAGNAFSLRLKALSEKEGP